MASKYRERHFNSKVTTVLIFPAAAPAEIKSNTQDVRVLREADSGDADFELKCLQNTQQVAI